MLAELEDLGAKSQDIKLVAIPGKDGITPNERVMVQARIAATNGYVQAFGREEDGESIVRSTREYAKIIKITLSPVGSILAGALQVARDTIIQP